MRLTNKLFSVPKLAAATCIIVLVALSVGIFNGKPHGNIAYAMVQAYEEVRSISGVIEYRNEVGGAVRLLQTTSFKYKSPNKFVSVDVCNNYTYTRTYDGGEKMHSVWSEEPGVIRVEQMDTDTLDVQLQWLLLRNIAQQLMENPDAVDQKTFIGEPVAGKQTQGYEITFNYNGHITIHRIWVDKQLSLPLMWEITYPGFVTEEGKVIPEEKILTYFTSIHINPELDDAIFTFKPEPGQR